MDVKEFLQGFNERYEKVLLFEPLNKLSAMQRKDAQNRPIDMRGLGILTLIYFFEQKIMRNIKVGRKQLAEFLYDATNQYIDLSLEQFHEGANVTLFIINTLGRSGK